MPWMHACCYRLVVCLHEDPGKPLVVAFLMSGARNMAAQLSLPKPTLGACGKMFMRQQRLVLDQRAEGHGG